MTYLERYLSGEYVAVWAELVALGEQVRSEAVYPQAEAVARETMLRVSHNLELLIERLAVSGYHFQFPQWVWVRPNERTRLILDEAERQAGGPLPLSLRAWYEVVGGVNLVGSHPWLATYYDYDRESEYQLSSYSDPLEVDLYLDESTGKLEIFDFEEFGGDDELEEANPDHPRYVLEIGADEFHKAGVSGGGPYYILFPDPRIDAPLHGDVDYGYFVEYLRECFRWGGFPGIRNSISKPEELLAFLTRDLLPF